MTTPRLAPFPVQPQLTAVAIAYRNTKLIADLVLPRVPAADIFKYLKHTMAEGFTLPDTLVGRKSEPNSVEFSATEVEASVLGYGLQDFIPERDIKNAPPNYNPENRAVEGIMDLIDLDREKRVADLVFTLTNYAAANRLTLSGSDQWNDPLSDPIKDIQDALDAMIMRGNIGVFGRGAFSVLQRHPKINKAINRSSGDSGIARREDIAALFELDEILVGEGWLNTAKKGQAASLSRVWGKHCSLLYRDSNAGLNTKVTFGFTAQSGTRIAASEVVTKVGLTGGKNVWAGEFVKEVISANDLGFMISNCVA